MNTYNKLMLNFWLVLAVLIFLITTYKGFTEGFNRWAIYYGFSLAALLFFFVRRFMMRRMEKHQEFMKNKESNKKEGK